MKDIKELIPEVKSIRLVNCSFKDPAQIQEQTENLRMATEQLIQIYSGLFDSGSIGSISKESIKSTIEQITGESWEELKK